MVIIYIMNRYIRYSSHPLDYTREERNLGMRDARSCHKPHERYKLVTSPEVIGESEVWNVRTSRLSSGETAPADDRSTVACYIEKIRTTCRFQLDSTRIITGT